MTTWSKPEPAPRTVVAAGAAVPAATDEAASGARWIEVPTAYDCIMLSSYGGPNGQDDVIPFLRNVTAGRKIPDERLEQVATHYRANGGVSPINEQNLALKAALEVELADRGLDLPIYYGNRNWEPYFTEAIATAHENHGKPEGRKTRIFALVTSAYSVYSACRQYREDFADALEALDLWDEVQIDKSRAFWHHPGFINPLVEGTVKAVRELQEEAPELDVNSQVQVYFSAHSVPVRDNELSGEPDADAFDGKGAYEGQHLKVGELVMERVNQQLGTSLGWELVYQSESGSGRVPWLRPDINDSIEELGSEAKALVVIPATFLSDHMEVWWDLDVEAGDAAKEKGLLYKRVPTPGVHPEFVSGLVDMVEERLNGTPASERAKLTEEFGSCADVCAENCCMGSGEPRAAIAGRLP